MRAEHKNTQRRLVNSIRRAGTAGLPRNPTYSVEALFVEAESADADLSHITIYGQSFHFVRKLESVGTMTADDLLLVQYGDNLLMTIIGVIVGDTSLASV